MVANRFYHRDYARAPGKEWEAEHAPYSWRRTADPAQTAAGGTGIGVRIRERAWAPFSPDGFNWMVKRAGQKAGLPFQVHAHMLRHSVGYKLAGDGHDTRAIQDYLGHRNIQHTVRYTELSPARFKDFWRD